jgi:hypothetical protein
LLTSQSFGFELFGRQAQGPVDFRVEGFRVGGLSDVKALSFVIGDSHGDPHLGSLPGANGLPAVG